MTTESGRRGGGVVFHLFVLCRVGSQTSSSAREPLPETPIPSFLPAFLSPVCCNRDHKTGSDWQLASCDWADTSAQTSTLFRCASWMQMMSVKQRQKPVPRTSLFVQLQQTFPPLRCCSLFGCVFTPGVCCGHFYLKPYERFHRREQTLNKDSSPFTLYSLSTRSWGGGHVDSFLTADRPQA